MRGAREHGLRFVVQHNGLQPKPQDRTIPQPPCPNEGKHPAVPPFGEAGSGCPNRWVLQAGAAGQVTGFQTENATKNVGNPIELESTLQNAWDNSDAIFVEIYEQRFWEAETAGPVLNPNASGRTTGDWASLFHERRRNDWAQKLGDPFRLTHRHTFKRTIASKTDNQVFYYINASKCSSGSTPKYGVIVILPNDVVSVDEGKDLTPAPADYDLLQNYPNPFNPETIIRFDLPTQSAVTLKIFDTVGREVTTLLASKVLAAGRYQQIWDGRDAQGRELPSGIYLYRLVAGDFWKTMKMALTR